MAKQKRTVETTTVETKVERRGSGTTGDGVDRSRRGTRDGAGRSTSAGQSVTSSGSGRPGTRKSGGNGAGHRRHSLGELAVTGVKDLPRNAAWALSKALHPVEEVAHEATDALGTAATRGRRAVRQVTPSGIGHFRSEGSVEQLVQRAARAAELASSAEDEAMRRADEARRTADLARRTAEAAEERRTGAQADAEAMIQSRLEAVEEAGAERIRRAEQEAREQTERVRAEVEQAAAEALRKLGDQLDREVASTREQAEESTHRAEQALAIADDAVGQARELAAEARRAAEEMAEAATRTADRLRWDDRSDAEAAVTSASAAAVIPRDELEDHTKAELLQLAADADVEGRSSMTKHDLIEALSSLSPTTRRSNGARR
ncbi:MAG: hypothetical protein MUE36_08295 [Acidimicrobiales bacterium]|jgi:hypothetical protein|nr:hypothetical protein [Acidimicrobiales bacterium]